MTKMPLEKENFEASIPSADSRSGSAKEVRSVVRDADVAARFLATLDDSVKQRPITPKEARKVLWKIDLTILPLIWISVIIASVDKLIISNAAIYGMATDTKLEGDKFAWVGRSAEHQISNEPYADSCNAASSISDSSFSSTPLLSSFSACP